jgi:hypothetical protein
MNTSRSAKRWLKMDNPSVVVAFGAAPTSSNFDPSIWMKLVQDDVESDVATIADTAELLDAMYETEPCIKSTDETTTEEMVNGLPDPSDTTTTTILPASHMSGTIPVIYTTTGGTEAATNEDGTLEPPVDEDTYHSLVNAIYKINACKNESNCHVARLRVYRSDASLPYKLVFDNGTATKTEVKNAEVNETPSLDKVSGYNLSHPLAGGLECGFVSAADTNGGSLIPPPEISAHASSLSWGIDVIGILDIRYTTEYDLVYINIPNTDTGDMGSCNVLAYYAGMVYSITVQPPKVDPTVSAIEKIDYCKELTGGDSTVNHKQTCYKEVHHSVLCACSNFESTASWDTEDDVPCPESFKNDDGRFILGSETVIAGTTDCGETDRGHSRDFYKAVCCHNPPPGVSLPKCLMTQNVFQGGMGINGGKEAIYAEYGPKAKIIAIGPTAGRPCGFLITKQVLPEIDCCVGVIPLEFDQAHSTSSIYRRDAAKITIINGKRPTKWQILTGGYVFFSTGTRELAMWPNDFAMVLASDNVCGDLYVKIDDGCTQITVHIPFGEDIIPLSWDASKSVVTIAPGSSGIVYVIGGVPPYFWTISGDGEMSFSPSEPLYAVQTDNPYVAVYSSDDACGAYPITCSDVCDIEGMGRSVQGGVRSSNGHWEADPDNPYSLIVTDSIEATPWPSGAGAALCYAGNTWCMWADGSTLFRAQGANYKWQLDESRYHYYPGGSGPSCSVCPTEGIKRLTNISPSFPSEWCWTRWGYWNCDYMRYRTVSEWVC